MSWAATAIVGGTLIGSVVTAGAQRSAADKQANAIKDAQGMSDKRYAEIRRDALSLFDDSMSSLYAGMQDGRDLILSGQASAQDILNQSYSGASQSLQTYGQQAINAMLGSTGQEPTVQNIQQIEPQLPQDQQTQPLTQVGPPPLTQVGPQPSSQQAGGQQGIEPQFQPGGDQLGQTGLFAQPDGTVRAGAQQGPFALPGPAGDQQGPALPDRVQALSQSAQGEMAPSGFDSLITDTSTNVNRSSPLIQQGGTLQGDFAPSGFGLTQTGLNVPQGQSFGLAGAEQALMSGAGTARRDLAQGTMAGISGLGRELGFAGDEVRRGRDFSLDAMRQAMSQGRGDIFGAMSQGRGDISSALAQGRGDISGAAQQGAQSALSGARQGVSYLSPYMEAGREALSPYSALSGARGQEAFDQALLNDPAYNLAIERSEQALGRQAALTGGIGGGNIAAELQRNTRLESAADVDRQLGRLRALTSAGQQAAGTAGGFTTQAGISAGGIQSQAGRDLSQLGQTSAQQQANLAMQGGGNLANISMQGGGALSQIGQQSSAQIADLARTMGISELQAMQMLGQNLGQIGMQTGQQLGDYRFNTGLNVANTLSQQGGLQAGLQTGLGGNLAGIDQQTAANLANQSQQLGQAQAGTQTGLAALLANTGTNQATQQANLGLQLGQAQAGGVTNPWGNALSTITGLAASNPDMFGFNQQPDLI